MRIFSLLLTHAISTPVPYTTLFRSRGIGRAGCLRKSSIAVSEQNRHRPLTAVQWTVTILLGNGDGTFTRSEEHTSELQSLTNLVCRLLLEKNKITIRYDQMHEIGLV